MIKIKESSWVVFKVGYATYNLVCLSSFRESVTKIAFQKRGILVMITFDDF